MWSRAVSGYTAAAVDLQLHAAAQGWAFRYDLLSAAGSVRQALQSVESCSVAQSLSAQVQRTARIKLADDDGINWGSDRIRPWLRLLMPDKGFAEWPIGTFLLSTPPRQDDGTRITRDVSCYDLGQVLQDDAVTDRYSLAAGTVVTVAVQSLLSSAGCSAQNVTASTATLPIARDWDLGTSKAQIVAALLDAINYEPLWFDALGVAQVQPHVALDSRPVEYTYQDDSESVLMPGISDGLDLFSVPNVIVAVVSEPDRSVLRSVYTNTNPASPTSVPNRGGRQIVRVERNQDAVDQATLDAIAARLAQQAAQVYQEVSFSTGLMPFHASGDVLQLVHSRLELAATFQETGWSLDCAAGASMRHTVRRVVPS